MPDFTIISFGEAKASALQFQMELGLRLEAELSRRMDIKYYVTDPLKNGTQDVLGWISNCSLVIAVLHSDGFSKKERFLRHEIRHAVDLINRGAKHDAFLQLLAADSDDLNKLRAAVDGVRVEYNLGDRGTNIFNWNDRHKLITIAKEECQMSSLLDTVCKNHATPITNRLVSPKSTVADATYKFNENISHLIVTENAQAIGKFEGIINHRNFLYYVFNTKDDYDESQNRKLADIKQEDDYIDMITKVDSPLNEGSTMREAVNLMIDYQDNFYHRALPILENDKIVSILSYANVLSAALGDPDAQKLLTAIKVKDLNLRLSPSKDFSRIPKRDWSIKTTFNLMFHNSLRGVPIIDAKRDSEENPNPVLFGYLRSHKLIEAALDRDQLLESPTSKIYVDAIGDSKKIIQPTETALDALKKMVEAPATDFLCVASKKGNQYTYVGMLYYFEIFTRLLDLQ